MNCLTETNYGSEDYNFNKDRALEFIQVGIFRFMKPLTFGKISFLGENTQ